MIMVQRINYSVLINVFADLLICPLYLNYVVNIKHANRCLFSEIILCVKRISLHNIIHLLRKNVSLRSKCPIVCSGRRHKQNSIKQSIAISLRRQNWLAPLVPTPCQTTSCPCLWCQPLHSYGQILVFDPWREDRTRRCVKYSLFQLSGRVIFKELWVIMLQDSAQVPRSVWSFIWKQTTDHTPHFAMKNDFAIHSQMQPPSICCCSIHCRKHNSNDYSY